MRLAVLAARIAGVVVALLFVATGFFILYMELKAPPIHSNHVYLAAAFILAGGVLVDPPRILSALKGLAGIVGPFVPWKRSSVAVKAPDEKAVNDQ